jgi:Zn-dependent M28 family amino/carboxypeptidase
MMKTPCMTLVALLLTLMMIQPVAVMSSSTMASAAEPPDADLIDDVSGQRLTDTISALSGSLTRAFYTDDCWNASVYVFDRFDDLGLGVYYQELEVYGSTVRNVIAIKNGSNPNAPLYLFGAHYDSANMGDENFTLGNSLAAPGADDDASGVAAVLEIAAVLRNSTFPNTIKFAAFAAEESGLNGSRYFAQQELAHGVAYADSVIFDMIGYRDGDDNRATIFCDAAGNTMSQSILSAIDQYDLSLSVDVVPGQDMVYSDHASFWQYGYRSLAVTEQSVNGRLINPYYHTAQDVLPLLSVDQMVEITKAVLGGFILLENPHDSENDWFVPVAAASAVAVVMTVGVVYVYMHRRIEQ